ncbi:hypothetical protein GG344DRAFT_77224 [Lentinula edodes]|nr:hypothetical protein GG344DRAFT_77224 [Lentinula edodes]
MSRDFSGSFTSSNSAALYQSSSQSLNPPTSTSSAPSPSSSSHSYPDVTSAPPLPPLQVVPAPPPDRPKRKRLARACNSCHKSKRRCDGTAPCSNCYFASKPCIYTDSSGRTVPAPRAAVIGPGNIPPNAGTGSNVQHPIERTQHMGAQDAHPSIGNRSFRAQHSSYGHAGPPYYLPPPSLPPLLPHPQQTQPPSSSHEHSYSTQSSSSNLYAISSVPRHEWDGNESSSSSSILSHPEHLSRKRQRQDSTDFASPVSLDTNWARENEYQKTIDLPGHRSTTFETTPLGGYATRPSIVLEPALTRELTNRAYFLTMFYSVHSLFFSLSPNFSCCISISSSVNPSTSPVTKFVALAPVYRAVCALASRHSKQPSLAATPRRLSGRHFADEAVRLMFENPKKSSSDHSTDKSKDAAAEPSSTDDLYSGVLVLPASLYTAQTLCLLTVYELLAWEQKPSTIARNFTRAGGSTDQDPKLISPQGERFRQLTLQMLQELGVHKPTYPLLTPVPSQAFIEESIEKECVRRIFWLIYILDCMREIYYQGEGELRGGSGRGYHSGGNLNGEISSHHTATQGSVEAIAGSQPSTNAASLPQSTSTTIDPSFDSPPFSHYNASMSFSPSKRAFSNGFIGFSSEELRVRLPVDETSFEMGAVHECLPEYLYLPFAPVPSTHLPSHKATATGSELAQTIRILSIYNKIERTLDGLYQPPLLAANGDPISFSKHHVRHYQARASLSSALIEDHELFSVWDESHPSVLRWDEGENVVVQKSMLETNSNTGAWCFCLIALLEASCIMGLGMGRRAVHGESWPHRKDSATTNDVDDTGFMASNGGARIGIDRVDPEPDWWKVSHRKDRSGETDLDWGVRRLDSVLETLGERAAYSAAMGAWIWPLMKYMHRDDEKIQKGLDGFEEFCGVRMDKLAGNHWGASSTRTGKYGELGDTEMADATFLSAEPPFITYQHGHVPQPVLDSQTSNSSAPVTSASSTYIGSENQLPLLQMQKTTLPSLKSSGLLDWSSRSSLGSHPGPAPLHDHSLVQLNVGTVHPNAYIGSASPTRTSGSLINPTASSTISGPLVASEPSPSTETVDTSLCIPSAQFGTSNTQPGRSGLSWMMNE